MRDTGPQMLSMTYSNRSVLWLARFRRQRKVVLRLSDLLPVLGYLWGELGAHLVSSTLAIVPTILNSRLIVVLL